MKAPSPIDTSSSSRLEDWLAAVAATPGLSALSAAPARERLVVEALWARELCASQDGTIVDVGSGNGSPGIPLAFALPERSFVLLDASRRRCDFLRRWAPENASVVWGRVETQERDWAGIALAKALAPPPVAAEWCLPLVRPGGAAVLWIGATTEVERVERVAARLAAERTASPPGTLVLRKLAPTPPGFPRRVGVARRRPLE